MAQDQGSPRGEGNSIDQIEIYQGEVTGTCQKLDLEAGHNAIIDIYEKVFLTVFERSSIFGWV